MRGRGPYRPGRGDARLNGGSVPDDTGTNRLQRGFEAMDLSPASQPGVPATRRQRLWRRLGIGVAALLALLIALFWYQYLTRGAFWRGTFERMASERAGRQVAVAGDFQLYFAPDLRFRAEGLSVANPDWASADHLFSARRIELDMPLWQLIFGPRTVSALVVDGGRVGLQRDVAGRNTWTFAGDSNLELPIIDRAAITDTRLQFLDAAKKARIDLVFGDVAGRAPASGRGAMDGALTFRGYGSLMGTPFTLDGALTTPNQAPAGGRVGLKLAVRAVDTRITVAGTLPGATRMDGGDLAVTVAGRNLQAPGRLFDIALPATRPYRLASRMTRSGGAYRFTGLTGRIGDSDIAGRLTVVPATATTRLHIDGSLASQRLAALDIGPLLGYDPAALHKRGGKAIVHQVAGTPRVLPDAPLAVEQLGNFDAKIDYRADRIATGTVELTGLQLGLTLDSGLLRLDPLALDVAGGRLSGEIGIDARGREVLTDYDLRLAQVPLKRLLTSFNLEDAGATASVRGRIRLKGRGNTVAKSLATSDGRIALVFPKGTLWIRNIQLAKLDVQNFVTAFLGKRLKKPAELRCGVLAFSVRDGRAVADPIVFDTTRATYRGAGGFRFDNESLALSIEGKSKEFSLFSGQSPVGIDGYFAEPGINIVSGELIGRAAAAIGLGVVASPFAAVLAFVDFAGAKDADCAPLLAGSRDTPASRAANAKPKA